MKWLITARCWLIIFTSLMIFLQNGYGSQRDLVLELHNAELPEAIRLVAKLLNMNVMVSSSVQGSTSLQLNKVSPSATLDLLLMANGLVKWQAGNIWLIAPKSELLKRQLEEQHWQDMLLDTAPLMTQFWQVKYAKAEEVGHLLQDEHSGFLSKRGRVRIDVRTNIICIQDTALGIQRARRLVEQLDVPVQQILIEARLASVDSDFERELGVKFSATHTEDSLMGVAKEAGYYSLAVAKLADSSLLDVKLTALENTGHAELISSPTLFASNQQAASIEAGEEVPYQETSESGGTAIVFKKAVLGLRVIPQVLPGKQVLLQLQINQDRPSNKLVQGMPTISTRQISTSVLVKSGQTLVLGGIYERNAELGQTRLPIVSQIPLFGLLFQQRNTRENKRELLIFVTPKIIT